MRKHIRIFFIALVISLSGITVFTSCNKSGEHDFVSFAWNYDGTVNVAKYHGAKLGSPGGPTITAGLFTNPAAPWPGAAITLKSFDPGTYNFPGTTGGNVFRYVDAAGFDYNAVSGSATITKSNNNLLSGSFSVTLPNGKTIVGQFNNTSVTP